MTGPKELGQDAARTRLVKDLDRLVLNVPENTITVCTNGIIQNV